MVRDRLELGVVRMERLQGNSIWLFSRNIDLSVFLGSAIVSLLLLAVGWRLGILNSDSPEWTWVSAVLLIDVAHVWSTSFRVYFDTEEFKRRLGLYIIVPVAGYAVGVALYSEGALTFWRVLAIVAVFHFVRQQYGWVALYRRKLGETERWTWWIDTAAVYLATIYPLAFWMTSLPRNFAWFVDNDFVALPAFVARILFPIYVLALADILVFAGGYLTGHIASPEHFAELVYGDPTWVILPGRIAMALFAIGTLALLYRLSRRLFGPSAALVAVALLIVSPMPAPP